MIKCYKINDKSNNNEVYSYKLTKDEIIKTCGSHSNLMKKLNPNATDYLGIQEYNNSLSLIIFSDENKEKKLFRLPLKKFIEENEIDVDNINNLPEAIKAIKFLIKEYNKLKKDFEEYKAKMEINFSYNSLYSEAYKLDNMYNNLSSKDIIQSKRDFYLINQGIQHLFKNNIVVFEQEYKSQMLDFNDKIFDKMFQNSENLILIIITQDNRRFGAFWKKNIKKENNINNMEINNIKSQKINRLEIYRDNVVQCQINRNFRNYQNKFENYNQNNYNLTNNYTSNKMVYNDEKKVIFNSTSSGKDYFVFSFDSSEIFYSNNYLPYNIIPSFSIILSRRILIVKENTENTIGYKLNGMPQSNIKQIELYSIQYGSL